MALPFTFPQSEIFPMFVKVNNHPRDEKVCCWVPCPKRFHSVLQRLAESVHSLFFTPSLLHLGQKEGEEPKVTFSLYYFKW